MSKFKLKVKLQGLELEIEGSREDASVMTQSIGQQFAGILGPLSQVVDGEVNSPHQSEPKLVAAIPAPPTKRAGRRKQTGSHTAESGSAATAVDFKHEPEKFGNPKQDWKTAQKACWLLYVLKEAADVSELSTKGIVDTFNKHFRQFGKITTSNVTRDLGKMRAHTPTPIGEDTTKNPSAWYLTEEGRKQAQSLVAKGRGESE